MLSYILFIKMPNILIVIVIQILVTALKQDVLGVGVLLAADSQSTSSSGYRASLWDP
jgi:hypothetical protein